MSHRSGGCSSHDKCRVPIHRHGMEIRYREGHRRCNSEKWYSETRDILDNESVRDGEFEANKCRWNHMHRNVQKSIEMSLKNLGEEIEYIDLLLLHCK